MTTPPHLRLIATLLLPALTAPAEDPDARLFRPLSHYIVANQRVSVTLNATPLPFVDWTYVQPGFVEYLNTRTGEKVPLNNAHDFVYATGFSPYPGLAQLRMLFVLNYDRATDGSDIRLSTSRDGRVFHFTPGDAVATHGTAGRPRGSFLAVVPSFVQAPDGRMLCFMNVSERPHKFPRHHFGGSQQTMAWWPADRLVALEAESYGEFTTPPMKLAGSDLRLNMAASRAGGIQVEVRDEKFLPIAGRTFAESDVLTGDDVSMRATWRGDSALGDLRGKTIHLRFRMRVAQLFALSAK